MMIMIGIGIIIETFVFRPKYHFCVAYIYFHSLFLEWTSLDVSNAPKFHKNLPYFYERYQHETSKAVFKVLT